MGLRRINPPEAGEESIHRLRHGICAVMVHAASGGGTSEKVEMAGGSLSSPPLSEETTN